METARQISRKIRPRKPTLPASTFAGLAEYLPSIDPRMKILEEQVIDVAASDETVLLQGETGVGKDLLARIVHEKSPRSGKPFVMVNCAALPHGLLESELFGHVSGAFTGAVGSHPGKFEMASGGTIFLNEITETGPEFQAKILHVLERKGFYPVGGRKTVQVDVRVIAASNRNLEKEMAAGKFRRDLFYRLCVVHLKVPPLRERPLDIERLVRFFTLKYNSLYNRPSLPRIDDEVIQALKRHPFGGNVRELENFIKRAILLGGFDRILGDLATASEPVPSPVRVSGGREEEAPAADENLPLKELTRRAVEKTEKSAILRALGRVGWNRRKAARQLQVSYRSLLYKIQDYRLLPSE